MELDKTFEKQNALINRIKSKNIGFIKDISELKKRPE